MFYSCYHPIIGVGGGIETDVMGIKDNEARAMGMDYKDNTAIRKYAYVEAIIGRSWESETKNE